ncbi:hypothetical protein Tco_0489975 [Tanacetum coccineum]
MSDPVLDYSSQCSVPRTVGISSINLWYTKPHEKDMACSWTTLVDDSIPIVSTILIPSIGGMVTQSSNPGHRCFVYGSELVVVEVIQVMVVIVYGVVVIVSWVVVIDNERSGDGSRVGQSRPGVGAHPHLLPIHRPPPHLRIVSRGPILIIINLSVIWLISWILLSGVRQQQAVADTQLEANS